MKRVGDFIYLAMMEIAEEIGGEALVERVSDIAMVAEGTLPNPEALSVLEEAKPGAAKEVMDRAECIQIKTQESELRALNAASQIKRGRALLSRFNPFNL